MRSLVAFMLLLTSLPVAADGQNPVCRDMDQPYQHLSADDLSELSKSCTDPAMAELMALRADHAQLVDDHAFYERLEKTQRSASDWHMDIDRVFLSLVEVYTGVLDLSPEQRMSVVQSAYARSNEIVELRLRGYDPQAALLELESWDPAALLMKSAP